MFVKYTPKTPHIKVIPLLPDKKSGEGYTFDNDSVTLRPGTNEITEKEYEAIKPHIKDQIGKEIMPFTVEAKPGKGIGKDNKAKALKDVPVATARKIIQACQDPNTLKKWFNQELPDEILLVLSKQMRKLKVEPEDVKEDDTDVLKDSDITTEDTEDTEDAKDIGGTGKKKSTKKAKTLTGDDTATYSEAEESTEDGEGDIPDFDGLRGGE